MIAGNQVFNNSTYAQISTTENRSGKYVPYFYSTNTFMSVPYGSSGSDSVNNLNHAFDGDFTIECWVKCSSDRAGQYADIIAKRYSTNYGSWILRKTPDDKITFSVSNFAQNAWVYNLVSQSIISFGQWTHIAVVRSGSFLKMFINGILSSSISNFDSVPYNQEYISISSANNSLYFVGYIDDIRITRAARYSSNFTPVTFIPKLEVRNNIYDEINRKRIL